MANRHAAPHRKRKSKRKERPLLGTALVLCFCTLAFVFAGFLWQEALRTSTQVPERQTGSDDDFRPQVGDPPYRVAIDAGHGGSDPGARGVVEEKDVTAETASALLQWLEQDSNYIPLQTRESFDVTATPAERAAAARAQAPQLLLSVHANSAANGSTAAGFECYPSVPGRTWHAESFYFARLLGLHCAGTGEFDTFIIWKTTRNSLWKVLTPKCGQSAASPCWKMWIARPFWPNSAL